MFLLRSMIIGLLFDYADIFLFLNVFLKMNDDFKVFSGYSLPKDIIMLLIKGLPLFLVIYG